MHQNYIAEPNTIPNITTHQIKRPQKAHSVAASAYSLCRRVTRKVKEGREARCPLSEIGNRCPSFGEKCGDGSHPWIRFLI